MASKKQAEVIADALKLDAGDRVQLVAILMRATIDAGEVEASSYRATLNNIEYGEG